MNGRWLAGDVLRALKNHGPARCGDLTGKLPGLTSRQISNGLCTLKKRNLVILLGDGRWRLTDTGKASDQVEMLPGAAGLVRTIKTPRKRSLRLRAWQALRRKHGKATIPDLLRVMNTDRPEDANNLGCYFRRLAEVGLLTRLLRRASGDTPTSPGYIVWLISEDTGPKAPIWQTGKNQVFDPNTGTIYPLPPKNQGAES
ncbi:MAG: hypothetical protein HQL95_02215 [Magnetococcales bacterium]|nr:hypothetical protein [Magnetococcales bacterium]